MRHKLRLFNLVLIVVLIFSFTACTISKTAKETTIVQTTITETTVVETTIPETTAAETTAPEAAAKGKIAFYSNRDGNSEIYIMNVDGSKQVNLTINPADDAGASFSPDGSKIAFDSNRGGNDEIYNVNFEIYIMNVNGSEQERLTNNPADDAYTSFSPDGSKIAFESNRDGNYEIYIMNVDGSGQINLTNNSVADDFAPSFSPDGSKIAFASDRDVEVNWEICMMNVDGSEQVSLTNNPAVDGLPSFSP